jgi:hypothetical protein
MLQDYSNKSCFVIDNGLFLELAVKLSKYFGKVYYNSPWKKDFPKGDDKQVGIGLDGIERVDEVFDYINDVDLFVFPDVYYGDLQLHLEELGKRVWGSRKGEELELFRRDTKQHFKDIGLNIGKYEVIIGIDKLREYLKKHDDVYVKVSSTRGDFETLPAKNYKYIETKIDDVEHILGARKYETEFIIEEAIKDAAEIGFDCYNIDGQYPKQAMFGIEIKDRGYIGFVKDYKDLPKQIIETNAKISDTLKQYRYRNFFAMEMRITKDGKPWIIDPCARFASPPGELVLEMYKNLPDIIWFGAEGELIEPEMAGKYGVEVMLHSSWANRDWQPIQFPDKIRDNIKLRNLTKIRDQYYVVPRTGGLTEIGGVVATGDTIEEASKKCIECCDQIEGYEIEKLTDSLDSAKEEMEKLEKLGISV